MASFAEIYSLSQDSSLMNRVASAIAVQSDVVRLELGTVDNHANRLLWAKQALTDPIAMSQRMIWAVIAANRVATKDQILAATDTAILAAVAGVVDVFATGS
jgi:hypothetical protein